MATAAKATGFKVPCPHCGAMGEDGSDGLKLYPFDLSMVCNSCDEPVTPADLRRMADDVARLLRWLEMASTV